MDTINHLQKANPSFLYEEKPTQELNVPDEIQRLWNHLKRYIELNDKRVQGLQQELQQKDAKIKDMHEFIAKQKDKLVVQQTREQVHKMNNATQRPPSTEPIDRTGVPPSEVQLEKIFYTGRGGQNNKNPFSVNF